jgi:hypothetical protein
MDDAVGSASGVAQGDILLVFAEAVVADDDDGLTWARDAVVQTLGPEAMVDAAGVASNFMRMVRIADSTGIPLDGPMAERTREVREELRLERFAGAQNMP